MRADPRASPQRHDPLSTLPQAFQKTAAALPDEVAVRTVGNDVVVTWREYAERVRTIAAGLAHLGVGHGHTVALTKLSRVEQVKRFLILGNSWDPGGDELTPTMKLKRQPIAEKYSPEIEKLYAATLGRTSSTCRIRAPVAVTVESSGAKGIAMDPLVSVHWLAEHLDDPRLRIFDATVQVRRLLFVPMVRAGRREWRREHIPGSAFANLFDLSDPGRPRRTLTMPTPQWFSERIGALGVSNDSRVVVYDRRENMWAARLWWMLRVFGFDEAAVLDGGWTAWKQAGHPVCSVPCYYPPVTFHATERSELVVDKDEVLTILDDPGVCLINALGRRQHRGEVNEYGRRGHIPGSGNVTAWEILDRQTQCYRPLPELQAKLGTTLNAERIITYCGAGAAAASLANVFVRLGHPRVAIYDGGLMEWCADRKLPLETGP